MISAITETRKSSTFVRKSDEAKPVEVFYLHPPAPTTPDIELPGVNEGVLSYLVAIEIATQIEQIRVNGIINSNRRDVAYLRQEHALQPPNNVKLMAYKAMLKMLIKNALHEEAMRFLAKSSNDRTYLPRFRERQLADYQKRHETSATAE